MNKNLYLLSYNNYYNRILKRFSELQEYNEAGAILHTTEALSFNPNDDVFTTAIVNHPDDIHPDYVLVCDEFNEIVSRWYIVESRRVRAGQYSLDLFRDLLADYYDEVMASPAYVEKGWAALGDPAIYNNEEMTYNQIKTNERLLKDDTNCSWIVGYLDKDFHDDITIDSIFDPTTPDYELSNLSSYQYYAYTSTPFYGAATEPRFRLNLQLDYSPNSAVIIWNKDGDMASPNTPNTTNGTITSGAVVAITNPKRGGYNVNMNNVSGDNVRKAYAKAATMSWNFDLTAYSNAHTTSATATFLEEDGKIIKVDQEYFQIKIVAKGMANPIIPIANNGSALALAMDTVRATQTYIDSSNKQSPVYELEFLAPSYMALVVPIAYRSATVSIPQNRTHTADAPYDIFAIPVPESPFTYLDTEGSQSPPSRKLNRAYAFSLAQAIIKKTTSGSTDSQLHDIQLVPYCPIPNLAWSPDLPLPGANFLKTPEGITVSYLVEQVEEEGSASPVEYHPSAIFWATSSVFTVDIKSTVPVPSTDLEFKVSNECDMYRIVSPNYSGGFEFSTTKNNGVAGFRADCAYKPYTPYIRVAPLFNNLYGNIQDDARGLVCGGDFSLPQSNDAWVSYEVNNKTYLQSFDRQIENLEVNNSIQRIMEKWNVGLGTVQGAVSGGMAGGMVGGGWGAAIGAVVGGGASLAGGLADIKYNEKLRQEALDYTKDMFGFQMQNIKALPESLTKISAFNPNNKIFPVLEYYTCTETEKQALRDKITYNGMTIGRIGNITDFLRGDDKTYIKAKIIRLENLPCDYHIANMIATELNKGVFMTNEYSI